MASEAADKLRRARDRIKRCLQHVRDTDPARYAAIQALAGRMSDAEADEALKAAFLDPEVPLAALNLPPKVERLAALWRESPSPDTRVHRARANGLEVFARDPMMRRAQEHIRRTDPMRYAEMESLAGELSLGQNLAALEAGFAKDTPLDPNLGEKTKRLAELWRGASLGFEAFFPREVPTTRDASRQVAPAVTSKQGQPLLEATELDDLDEATRAFVRVHERGDPIGGVPRREIILDALAGELPHELNRFSDEELFQLKQVIEPVVKKVLAPDEVDIATYLSISRLTLDELSRVPAPPLVREYARFSRESARLHFARDNERMTRIFDKVNSLVDAVCTTQPPGPSVECDRFQNERDAEPADSAAREGWIGSLLRSLSFGLLGSSQRSSRSSRVAIMLVDGAGRPIDDLLTVEQAKAYLGLSQQRLSQLMTDGTLRRHEVGPRFFAVERKQVEEYARQDRKPGPKPSKF